MEIGRREFFKILGAGGASAALGSCSESPPETLMPYVIPPEELIPGVATWYATVCRECPAGCGMLARTREGRVVKVEGNPAHPVNQGRLCARGQASLQGLYNPDRLREPLSRDRSSGQFRPISWDEAERRVAARLADLRQQGNADRVAFLSPLLTGSLDRLIDTWLAALGSQRRLRYEPFAYEPLRTANRLTFGRDAIPTHALASARFLLSFGADFLETWISPLTYARDFATLRSYRDGRIGTFVYVGPRLSLTAANADRWLPIKPGTDVFLALGMIRMILAEGLEASLSHEEREKLKSLVAPYTPEHVSTRTEIPEGTIFRLARAFARDKPSLALAGGVGGNGSNATETCVAINLLNYVVGNVETTVRFGPGSRLTTLAPYRDVRDFIDASNRGSIEVLFCYDVNPVFTLPQAAGFREALQRVPLVVSFSSFLDETTADAHLILPDHTPLESWGDYDPWEGVHGLMQPVMRPLYQTRALGDTLLSLAQKVDGQMAERLPWPSFYEYLRAGWQELQPRLAPAMAFETFWEQALTQGGVWEDSTPEPVRLSEAVFQLPFEAGAFAGEAHALYLHLYPSLLHFDGRGANRPWLQELPDPMTQIVWDNWVEIHPETAQRLGIVEGAVVKVTSLYGMVELSAHLYEGMRPDVLAIPLGQGHTAFGRYAAQRGMNPMALLPPTSEALSGSAMLFSTRVTVTQTGRRSPLASPAGSDRQWDRGIVQAMPLSELGGPAEGVHEPKQIYPPHAHSAHRWGMVIDLNACIGCSACVVACYAENNVPVVGKEQVAQGRGMAWLRIERYFEGDRQRPETRFLPMLCQQCDNAPCEPVCPVYATYHTPEGLNAQIYPRCVGVRYCANNCPYQVRRFNWFEYPWPDPLHLQLNPDVTVRTVGVMEKCTFCVQRITEGQERARDEGRPVGDGEIVPACAQTCPTRAIVFGDLQDPRSEVAKLARDPRRYRVLEHLNTQPAITYLKKIRQDTEQM